MVDMGPGILAGVPKSEYPGFRLYFTLGSFEVTGRLQVKVTKL